MSEEMKEAKRYVTVSTRLPSVEATSLKIYTEHTGSNPSEFIRDAILEKISHTQVSNVAGRNKIEYNPKTDSFTWKVELDGGKEHIVLEHLSHDFIQDLQKQLSFELRKRAEALSKKNNKSVAVPRRLVR